MTDAEHLLVTGATGFLGRHLVRFLADRAGYTVWAVSRSGGRVGDIQVEALDLASGDRIASWRRGKPTFRAVLHLAALVPASFDSQDAEVSFNANLAVDQNVLAIALHDRATFVYASSTSVYGAAPGIPFTEDLLVQPDNLYSLGKHVGEGLCYVATVRHGLPAVALRLSAPYGPGQRTRTVIATFLRCMMESRDLTLYGSGRRTQDFTYVDDVVQAMWRASRARVSGVYNVASGHPVTMRKLAEAVVSLVPGTGSCIRYVDRADTQEGYRGIFSIEKARRDLGYEPRTSLIDGLRRYLEAMRVDVARERGQTVPGVLTRD